MIVEVGSVRFPTVPSAQATTSHSYHRHKDFQVEWRTEFEIIKNLYLSKETVSSCGRRLTRTGISQWMGQSRQIARHSALRSYRRW